MNYSNSLNGAPLKMTDVTGDYIIDQGPSMTSFLMAGTNQGSDVSKLIIALMVHQKSESAETPSKENSEDKKVNATPNGGGGSNDSYGLANLGNSVGEATKGFSNIDGGKAGSDEGSSEKPADPAAASTNGATPETPPVTPPPAAAETPSETPAAE